MINYSQSIKISQLSAMTGSAITVADYVPIVNSATLTTQKVTLGNISTFFIGFSNTGSFTGSFTGSVSGTASYSRNGMSTGSSYPITSSWAQYVVSASTSEGIASKNTINIQTIYSASRTADINIFTGYTQAGRGIAGNINITAGGVDGDIATNPGNVNIYGGSVNQDSYAGNVNIYGGSTTQNGGGDHATGGNVIIQAGSGSQANGYVYIKDGLGNTKLQINQTGTVITGSLNVRGNISASVISASNIAPFTSSNFKSTNATITNLKGTLTGNLIGSVSSGSTLSISTTAGNANVNISTAYVSNNGIAAGSITIRPGGIDGDNSTNPGNVNIYGGACDQDSPAGNVNIYGGSTTEIGGTDSVTGGNVIIQAGSGSYARGNVYINDGFGNTKISVNEIGTVITGSLQATGNVTASNAWFGKGAPDESAISASLYLTANTNPSYKWIIDADAGDNEGLHVMSGSGYVGIGTDNPVNKLDVVGNISASSFTGSLFGTSSWASNSVSSSYASNSGTSLSGGAINYIPLWLGSSTLTTSSIYQTGGNIGIGTNTPNSTLSVVGNISASVISASNIAPFTSSNFKSTNATITNLKGTLTGNLIGSVSSGSTLSISTTAGNANVNISTAYVSNNGIAAGSITIRPGGIDGDNSTNPGNVNIYGGACDQDSPAGNVNIYGGSTTEIGGTDSVTGGNVIIQAGSGSYARGNVYINDGFGNTKISVNEIGTVITGSLQATGNVTASNAWFGKGAPDESAISASLYLTANTNPSYKWIIDADAGNNEGLHVMSGSGYVGIGTDYPAYTLDVSGSANFIGGIIISGNTSIVPVNTSGSMFFSSSRLWVFTGTGNNYGAGVGWSTASLSI